MRRWLWLALALAPACSAATTQGIDAGYVGSCSEAFAAIGGPLACRGGTLPTRSRIGCGEFTSCLACSCIARCDDGGLSVFQLGHDTGCDLDASGP